MRRFFIGKRRLTVFAAIAAFVVVGAGSAFAYFTSTGSGTGSAQVGKAAPWGVSVTSDANGGPLFPGGNTTLDYTITNQGKGAQAFSTVTATVNTDGSGNVLDKKGNPVAGCLASWFTATVNAPTPAYNTSIAPNGTAAGTVTVAMTDASVSQNACVSINGPQVTVNVDAP